MHTRGRSSAAILVAICLALFALGAGGSAQEKSGSWIVAWTTSMVSLAQNAGGRGGTPELVTFSNATLRMIVRPTLGGSAVRVRVDNTFGTSPLTIGAGTVGLSLGRRGLIEGTGAKLTFGGSSSVTIPAGKRMMSDQAMLKVRAGQDVAVSLYLPDSKVPVTSHNGALTTSFLTKNDAGNHAGDVENTAFTETTNA